MADLPEYTRRHETTPIAKKQPMIPGVSIHFPEFHGIQETFNQIGKSTSYIGEIGAAIAQNAANQLATIRGTEEAKNNPSRNLLPAFTESDKYFKEAFEKETFSNASFAASKLIQNQLLLAEQNPNSNTFELFQKNVTNGLEQIINAAPESIRNNLQKTINKIITIVILIYLEKYLEKIEQI